MATIRDLLTDSLKTIGVIEAGGTATAADAADGLTAARRLLDTCNANRLCVGAEARSTYPWPAATRARTLGPTGDLVGTRPLWLAGASVIPAGQTDEMPMGRPLTRRAYAEIPDKTTAGPSFTRYHYEPTFPNGTVTVYPVPTTASTLVVYAPVPLTTAVTLATPLSYAQGYEEALQYALAKRLAPVFRQPWSALLEGLLQEAMATIRRENTRGESRRNDPALVGRGGSFAMHAGRFR